MAEKRENPSASQRPAMAPAADLAKLSGLRDVDVKISVEWGRTQIPLEEAMALGEKALLPTDKTADEPVDIFVNGRLFARGKLVVVGDSYGVQLLEIV